MYIFVMALEGVTKRTEHHGYSTGIYLQEQRMVTRTWNGKLVRITVWGRG